MGRVVLGLLEMKRTKKHYGGDYIPFFIFSMVLLWELYMVVPPTVEAQDQVRYLDSSHSTGIELSMSADAWFPKLLEQDTGVSYAIGSTAQATLLPIGPLDLMTRARVFSILTGAGENLFYLGGAAGLGLSKQLSPRLSLRTAGFAGLGQIPDIKVPGVEEKSYGLYELGIRLEASYRLSASTRISLFTGFEQLATPTSSFINAPSVGIGFEINPGEMLRSRGHIDFREVDTEPVFPVLRSWYDTEPLGSVSIRNLEDGPIERVRVYFHVPEYMEGSRLCVSKERLEQGEELEADLFAVFDERILALPKTAAPTLQ